MPGCRTPRGIPQLQIRRIRYSGRNIYEDGSDESSSIDVRVSVDGWHRVRNGNIAKVDRRLGQLRRTPEPHQEQRQVDRFPYHPYPDGDLLLGGCQTKQTVSGRSLTSSAALS